MTSLSLRLSLSVGLLLVLGACGSPDSSSLSKTSVPPADVLGLPSSPDEPSSSSPTAPSGTVALDGEEQAFLGLINSYRSQNGLGALTVSATLTQASDWLSVDMATYSYFDHTDRLGRDFFTRLRAFGYSGSTGGENIAAGNSTAQATFTQWRSSPGHNANMLGLAYKTIGIGRAYVKGSPYGWYWTTDFGNR